MLRLHPHHSGLRVNNPLFGEIHRNLDVRGAGALARAGLQHPELATLNGELHILHVPIVLLQHIDDLEELSVDLGHHLFQAGVPRGALLLGNTAILSPLAGTFQTDAVWRADARDDILTLCVGQELTVEILVLARGGITAESHAGGGVLTHVAKDHGLHVDGGAPIVGDTLVLAVSDGAFGVPGVEDGLDGEIQLLVRIGGEVLAELLLVHLLVLLDQPLESFQADLGVEIDALFLLQIFQFLLEVQTGIPHHDIGEHGDEAAVRIVGKPLVFGQLGEGRAGLVVEAQVEDGVHHARHRDAGAGADRDQERILRVTELLAGLFLNIFQCIQCLFPHPLGELVRVHVGRAGLGGDGESRGNRCACRRHRRQTGTLAAHQFLHLKQLRFVTQALGVLCFRVTC